MTKHIVLSERQERLAQSLVDSGRFASVDEVLDEGLRLVADHQPSDKERFASLQAAIQVGLDDLEQGRFDEFATHEDLEAHLDAVLAEVVARKKSA